MYHWKKVECFLVWLFSVYTAGSVAFLERCWHRHYSETFCHTQASFMQWEN